MAIAVKALLRNAISRVMFIEFALVSPHNVTTVIAAAPRKTTNAAAHARVF